MNITITMTDTITLSIPFGSYTVNDSRKFKPYFAPFNQYDTSERIRFLQEHRGLRKYLQNPQASYRDQGIVYPNLRIDERMRGMIYTCDLKVTFSCPKLIWGHSFEEVTDGHFSLIVEMLMKRLVDMGISVTEEAIKSAIVHTLHYCANIQFPSEEDARMFLNRLSNTSLKAWFENNTKTFANNGNAVRFHTDIFEIVFYLKYYDALEKGNRSVGRKTTLQEKQTVKRLLKEGSIPPVVRMEIRFNGTRSVRNHLKTALGIESRYWTFKDAYDSLKSRTTQRYYWNQIIDDPLNNTYLSTVSDQDLCEKVLEKFPNETIKDISESLGLFYITKSLGVSRIKAITILRQNRKAWYDKRKKIISFSRRFIQQDETLIKIVTSVLENKPLQLDLPI